MQTIEAFKEPRDTLRDGISMRHNNLPHHPVEVIQKSHFRNEWERKKQTTELVFGAHMPLRLQMEAAILSQFQRLPGIKSEFVGLEILLGTDEDITVEDVFNDPEFSEELIPPLHETMEKRLGMLGPKRY